MTTCFLAPDPIQSTFFIPGGNVPGNGVQVFFYVAGSVSTKQTVYKDPAANVAWSNAIVLDSGGNLPLGGEVWFPSGQTFKVVWAPSNDSDPPVSPYRTMDNLSGINDVTTTATEWIAGPTPTFISGTSFSVAGDQTINFNVGRRVKATVTAGTVYGRIFTSVFGGALTTVTLVMDSTNLDAGLSAVFYAVLSATNPSEPLVTDAFPIRSGSADKSKVFAVEVDSIATSSTVTETIPIYSFIPATQTLGSDLTAGTTTNVSTVTGSYANLVAAGTTTIGQFTMFPGQDVVLQSATTFTLVNSTSLALPGANNLQINQGDLIRLRGSSSNVGYFANFMPAGVIGEVRLASGTALNTSRVNIIMSSTPYTNYKNKRLMLTSFIPASNAVLLSMRLSSTGGVSFDSGAANYGSAFFSVDQTGNNGTTAANSTSMFLSNSFLSNSSFAGLSTDIKFFDTTNSLVWPRVSFSGSYVDSSPPARLGSNVGGGSRSNPQITNAIQLFFEAGNVSSGSWTLFGSN